MVCGGNSQLSYSEVKSGECDSVSGRFGITDKATCETAAGDLGFSDTTATEVSESYVPPGCFWWVDELAYNPDSSSTKSCSSTFPCLCLSAPECTRINGNEPNTAVCICGDKRCPEAGSYCEKSTSTCTLPLCSRKDGLTANNAACLCFPTKCSADSGFYCTKSTRTCSDVSPCSEQDGLTANNAACQCDFTKCSTDSGFYCTRSTSTCGFGPACSRTDGTIANDAPSCLCGTKGCTSNTGLFCFKSSNGAGGCDKVAHSVAYSQVESGECGSVSGRVGITDKATCETAAGNLGFSDTTVYEVSYSDNPSGCFRSSGGSLYYNTKSSSTISCSSSNACLCLSAPECTRINGNEPNTAVCICGTIGCSDAGSYCVKSSSSCSPRPLTTCANKNGMISNAGTDCKCGSSNCIASSGYYCVESSDSCSPRPPTTCAVITGMTPNTAGTDCKCGSSNCISSSGYYCIESSNSCSPRPPTTCAITNGLTSNTAGTDCKCGSSNCIPSSGYYCVESSNSCSPRPPTTCVVTNGLTSNAAGTDCKCGDVNCISSSGYYCDQSISTCSTVSSCSEQDGLITNIADCQCGSAKCSTNSGFYCTKTTSTCALAGDNFCGIGEFQGPGAPVGDTAKCICKPTYFSGLVSACEKCPEKESVCDLVGMHAPVVKPDYWRADPTSPNITTVPFYSCPFPNTCLGGNSTDGCCATGHDDNSPVCAICSPDYVLQGDQCVPCPGSDINAGASVALWAVTGSFMFLLFIAFIIVMRRPALSKADETRIITLIESAGVNNLFAHTRLNVQTSDELDMDQFTLVLAQLHASLSKDQIRQLYNKIDTDKSNGISPLELSQYINQQRESVVDKISNANDKINETKDDLDDKLEKKEEVMTRVKQLGDATGAKAVGGIFMKIKLLVGFGQVLSYYPVTFDTIPWPLDLSNVMKFMEIFSVDIFSVFGGASCQLQTGFLTKFMFHMALVPGILLILLFAFGVVRTMSKSSKVFTPESVTTALYTLMSLVLYTLYVGVSTRIFRLFKCRKIMDVWYLTADYTVVCFEGAWTSTSIMAYIGMGIFVVGIPLFQFLVLWKNRKYLDENKLTTDEDYRQHLKVKQKYGSIFEAYTPECYYYDLIDLIRRLILTGGLILIGDEEAVAQIFLGILISSIWLCLVLNNKPYASSWDTALSSVLSFVLMITLVSGVCMRLYEVTLDGADEYQRNAFGAVLIASIIVCLVLSVAAVIMSTECLRDRAAKICQKKKVNVTDGGNDDNSKSNNSTKVTPISDMDKEEQAKKLRNIRKQHGAGSDEYQTAARDVQRQSQIHRSKTSIVERDV
jgi:hypothetical protein